MHFVPGNAHFIPGARSECYITCAVSEQKAAIKAASIKLTATKGVGYVRMTWTVSGKYSLEGYDVYKGNLATLYRNRRSIGSPVSFLHLSGRYFNAASMTHENPPKKGRFRQSSTLPIIALIGNVVLK